MTVPKIGACETCDNYVIIGEDKSLCVSPTCDERFVIQVNGECNKCDDFQIVVTDKLTCI